MVHAQGPDGPLKTRVLFHSWHKLGDDAKLMEYHHELGDSLEEQLSLAAIHFLRAQYQVP